MSISFNQSATLSWLSSMYLDYQKAVKLFHRKLPERNFVNQFWQVNINSIHIHLYVLLQLFYFFWNKNPIYVFYAYFHLPRLTYVALLTSQPITLKVFCKINTSVFSAITYPFNPNYLSSYRKEIILTWCREKPQEIARAPSNNKILPVPNSEC